MNDVFVTETDVVYARRSIIKPMIIIFLILSLLACLGFFIAWQTFLYFEVFVIISCIVAVFFWLRRYSAYKLRFEGDRLLITNIRTSEQFEVFDIPASDFVITQTDKEKERDYCSLMIKNTIFMFGSVKKYSDLKEYIDNHF